MYKVLLGGYISRYRIETRTLATNEIVDKGRGSAVSLSHENYINLRPGGKLIMWNDVHIMEQRILQLENLLHGQEVEIRRLSNAIERMSTAMTAVRMNESKGKKKC